MSESTPPPAAGTFRQAGYSLVEMLVATLVISLAVSGLYAALAQTQTYFEAQSADVDMRQEARVAMDQLVTELRHAGYSTGNVDEILSGASDTSIEFAADVDDGDDGGPCDGALEAGTNSGSERISYTMTDAGTLTRSVDCWNGAAWVTGLSAMPVLDGLTAGNAVFSFFDETGTQLPPGGGTLDADTRELIRSVRISFDVEDSSVDQQVSDTHTNYQIESRVRLRNMGDGS